tara:strand:+ start:89 stop:610 length:522 start_codon:yes stop_codon:yes gene_type:complete
MAKTDHFYVRAEAVGAAASNTDISIDLGAFVDALGKSVLKIHSISIAIQDEGTPGGNIACTANNTHTVNWQLSTQALGAYDSLDNKSVISRGATALMNGGNGSAGLVSVADIGDRVDQRWVDGYLVAVEQIYFRADTDSTNLSTGPLTVSIMLDCTVESLTKDAAMALALSQQ